MLRWYAVFAENRHTDVPVEANIDGEALARFDKAAETGILNGQRVIGMWVIDEGTEPRTLIRTYGPVRGDIV